MPINHQAAIKPWWAFIFTHNPFYVISALMTLYGLHVSFSDNIDPTRGWLQLEIFIGYMFLLAATGVLIVRLGQVWEDARTLFLLVLLLMVALSVSFDRVCLDDEYLGLQFLTIGLGASLLLCEFMLRALKVLLPWTYRGVLYLQLTILFCYPPWLGHLSLTDQLTPLAWWTLGFPTLIAASIVLLVPVARRRKRGLRRNGTPWRWPMYPWTLFVVLGIGIAIRAFTFTFSFDPTKGFNSGFQPYFLIPLLLSVILIVAETSVRRRDSRPWWRFVLSALSLFVLSLPGVPASVAQGRYLELLQGAVGSPIQITAVLLIVYFAYLLSRGIRAAEWGMLLSLGVMSVVDHNTLDINTLAEINPIPACAGLLLLIGSAILRRNTARLCLATLGMMAAACYTFWDTEFVEYRGYLPVHLAIIFLVLVSLAYSDGLARLIRRYSFVFLIGAAVFSFLSYRYVFPSALIPWHALYVLCLAGVAAICWLLNKQFTDLTAIVICLFISAGHLAEHYLGTSMNLAFLQGRRWIAWGAVSFFAGLVVSFAKGGQLRRLCRLLYQRHLAAQQPPADQ